jgi:hypothetical protein
MIPVVDVPVGLRQRSVRCIADSVLREVTVEGRAVAS